MRRRAARYAPLRPSRSTRCARGRKTDQNRPRWATHKPIHRRDYVTDLAQRESAAPRPHGGRLAARPLAARRALLTVTYRRASSLCLNAGISARAIAALCEPMRLRAFSGLRARAHGHTHNPCLWRRRGCSTPRASSLLRYRRSLNHTTHATRSIVFSPGLLATDQTRARVAATLAVMQGREASS